MSSGFKLVLKHGPAFTEERQARLVVDQPPAGPSGPTPRASLPLTDGPVRSNADENEDERLLAELTNRGITACRARQLLAERAPVQDVLRQLEWGDAVVARAARGKFWNPAGFYVALVRDNLEPPADFLSSEQQREREEAYLVLSNSRRQRQQLETAYERYRDEQAASHLGALDEDERQQAIETKIRKLQSQFATSQWALPTSIRSPCRACVPSSPLGFRSSISDPSWTR